MLTWLEVAQGVVCLCLLVTCGCHAGSDGRASSERGSEGSARHVPRVDWSVEFTGPGLNKPAIFTFEQLARMEMTRLDNVVMLKTHGPDETTGWRGPSLDVLLTETQVNPGPMPVIVEALVANRIGINTDVGSSAPC